jgi:hypothetical protein
VHVRWDRALSKESGWTDLSICSVASNSRSAQARWRAVRLSLDAPVVRHGIIRSFHTGTCDIEILRVRMLEAAAQSAMMA